MCFKHFLEAGLGSTQPSKRKRISEAPQVASTRYGDGGRLFRVMICWCKRLRVLATYGASLILFLYEGCV